ncbi:MAG: AMP-binding protein [Rubrivivax sp.]
MFPTLLFDQDRIDPDRLRDQTLRAARGLAAMGVREGDVVAIMLRNEPAAMQAILAARHLGAYWCGLNWHFKSGEARWLLEDSRASVLIVHADLLPQIADGVPDGVQLLVVEPAPLTRKLYGLTDDAIALALVSALTRSGHAEWSAWWRQHEPSAEAPRRPRGLMPYTSGTTGRPKGVKRVAPATADVASRAADAERLGKVIFGVGADSICLMSAPLYHSAPASYAAFCSQMGATLRLEPKFDALRTLRFIEAERISHLYLVPTMYQRLLRLPDAVRAAHDTASVRFVASTGSACPAPVKQAMIDWWGPVINEAYASSETGYVTFIDSADWLTHRGSAGRVAGNATLRIVDAAGTTAPVGEIGTIYAIQRDYPDFEYANNPASRRAVELDGLVTLGDMGYVDADGFLYVCDRNADMVISGGVNIYPAEIEAELSVMPGIADCAVFGIPDDEWGEALAAAVQLRDGAVVSEDQVRSYIAERMAGYKVPKVVAFHESLPREDSGKLFKRKLRAPYWERAGRSI